MRKRDSGTGDRKPWNLEGIEGAALRNGREKHLDKELELPSEEITELRIPVLEEMYRGLKEVIAENGWDEEEGLRTMLAAGLGYMRVTTLGKAHEEGRLDDTGFNSRLQTLRDLVTLYEARYSAMKFKAYQFQEKSKILEMRVSGLVGTERLREAWAIRIRDRLEALEEEHREVERRIAEYEQRSQRPFPEEVRSPTWWQRFRALVADFGTGGRADGAARADEAAGYHEGETTGTSP